jgi:hypothetical protein
MKLNQNTRLAELMYGHGDKFMQSLSGKFEPGKFSDAPAIQVCELKCKCWVIADGNNRVGLILRNNPDATLADIPKGLISIYKYGDWDDDTMKWWNPEPKTIGEVMIPKRRIPKILDTKGSTFHGMIERTPRNQFNAVALVAGKSYIASASKAEDAKRLLGAQIRKAHAKKSITLIIRPLIPMDSHQCLR